MGKLIRPTLLLIMLLFNFFVLEHKMYFKASLLFLFQRNYHVFLSFKKNEKGNTMHFTSKFLLYPLSLVVKSFHHIKKFLNLTKNMMKYINFVFTLLSLKACNEEAQFVLFLESSPSTIDYN